MLAGALGRRLSLLFASCCACVPGVGGIAPGTGTEPRALVRSDTTGHLAARKVLVRSAPSSQSIAASESGATGVPLICYVTGRDDAMSGDLKTNWDNNLKFMPPGTQISYFNDKQMYGDAKRISGVLQRAGLVTGAYEAFVNLRPGAFRADLWRYMRLWDTGGIYMDTKITLLKPLENWIDMKSTTLQTVKDWGIGHLYNAVIVTQPRDPGLVRVINLVVKNIQAHLYVNHTPSDCAKHDCSGDLAVTGPIAFANGLGVPGSTGALGAWSFVSPPTFTATASLHLTFLPGKSLPTKVSIMGPTGEVAVVNEGIHKTQAGPVTYEALWLKHQVYCDEPGPPCPKF